MAEGSEDDEFRPVSTTRDELCESWKSGMKRLDTFWKTFHEEYVKSLRERYQISHQQARSVNPKIPEVREVVLLKEENVPRNQWSLGKVICLE